MRSITRPLWMMKTKITVLVALVASIGLLGGPAVAQPHRGGTAVGRRLIPDPDLGERLAPGAGVGIPYLESVETAAQHESELVAQDVPHGA